MSSARLVTLSKPSKRTSGQPLRSVAEKERERERGEREEKNERGDSALLHVCLFTKMYGGRRGSKQREEPTERSETGAQKRTLNTEYCEHKPEIEERAKRRIVFFSLSLSLSDINGGREEITRNLWQGGKREEEAQDKKKKHMKNRPVVPSHSRAD